MSADEDPVARLRRVITSNLVHYRQVSDYATACGPFRIPYTFDEQEVT